jgi:hypothetical protein
MNADANIDLTMNGPTAVTARFELPIENWRALHFTAAELADESVSGDAADPDGDGVPNACEDVHGSDPRDRADRGWEAPRAEGGFFTMIYTRLQGIEDGYQLRVRGSRDYATWNEAVEDRILSVAAGVETREARISLAGHARGFLGFDYSAGLSLQGWRRERFTAAELADELISGDDADPDRDGLRNWQEFLHGSDPKDASSGGGLAWRAEGGFLVMTFTRRTGLADGFAVSARGSRDLLNWNAPDVQESVLTTVDGIQSVEARLPITGQGRGYLRAEYSRP